MYLYLAAFLCIAAFGSWLYPRIFSVPTVFLFIVSVLIAVDSYFGRVDLPDSVEYISFFAGEQSQYGAESWLFSMRLYAWVVNILSLGMLGPESMLYFARLLNLGLYLFFFCLICRGSLAKLSIICPYFFTSLLAYNCIFQIRAGFAYVLTLLTLYWLYRRFFRVGDTASKIIAPLAIDRHLDGVWSFRVSRSLSLSVPSVFAPFRLFRRFALFSVSRFCLSFLLIGFIVLIHSSALVYLFCGLAVYGWAFFAQRLKHAASSLPVVVLLWSSVIGVAVYFIVTGFLDLYVPFLSDVDFANSAFSLAGEAESGVGFGLFVLAVRSMFFIYLGCLYIVCSRSTLSYYLSFPMILYGIFRPAFSAFFSFARILSPILILQLFVLAASRKYILGYLRLFLTGIVLIFLMFAQAYSLAPILDHDYSFDSR